MYVSDLKRTQDTANAIYKFFPDTDKPKMELDMRLREKGAGVLEGKPLGTPSTLAKQAGVPPRMFKPEGGESWLDVNERVKDFLKDIAARHIAPKKAEEERKGEEEKEGATPRVLCVTHGGLIMEFLNYVDSLKSGGEEVTRTNKAKNCAIFVFAVTIKDSGLHIETLVENDVDHLTGDAQDRGRGKGNA